MSGMRALRYALASVVALVVLEVGPAPAYAWHGSGSITALAIDAVDAWVETGTPPGALPGSTLLAPATEWVARGGAWTTCSSSVCGAR